MQLLHITSKELSNGVSYARFGQVTKEIRHFQNQYEWNDEIAPRRPKCRAGALQRLKIAQMPRIVAPRCQIRSVVTLLHQFGPYHYEKARNSPKTPKFPSMNPKIIKGTRKLKKRTEKEAKRAIPRLEEGDFGKIERRSNHSPPRSRVFHSFSFFST